MGKDTGFLEYDRQALGEASPKERVSHWREFKDKPQEDELKKQTARCMDCGTPFCHTGYNIGRATSGCPINNLIPEWNDLVYRGKWKEALARLHKTNNFPEFTGRVCPAPCEGSCVLGYIEPAVTIKNIEFAIAEKGWKSGWIKAKAPQSRSDKTVGIVGSGPAGLAAADQLNKIGHSVTVYERADRLGGLLMYGIPNMKLDKREVVERRVDYLKGEGIAFVTECEIGKNLSFKNLRSQHHALLFCTGATVPRDLPIPGRESKGVHFAMDYLTSTTAYLLDTKLEGKAAALNAQGKDVVVLGGGDTGTDCIATAVRQGCKSILQLEIMPRPPDERSADNPWPEWPHIYRLDYGQKEAASLFGSDPRQYLVTANRFLADDQACLEAIEIVPVRWQKDSQGAFVLEKLKKNRRVIPAKLAFLALGFLGPEQALLKQAGLSTTKQSNISTPPGAYATAQRGIFAAGDCRRGQSLVVWAIHEGREAAREINAYLAELAPRTPQTSQASPPVRP